jgi:hypothetical protein
MLPPPEPGEEARIYRDGRVDAETEARRDRQRLVRRVSGSSRHPAEYEPPPTASPFEKER